MATDVKAVIATLIELGRPFIRELALAIVEQMNSGAVDEEIDQRSAAALRALRLSPRRFLEAAREGCFPFERRGRRTVARLRDVEAWRTRKREERRRERYVAALSPADQMRVELGYRPKGEPYLSPDDEERIHLGLRPKGERQKRNGEPGVKS